MASRLITRRRPTMASRLITRHRPIADLLHAAEVSLTALCGTTEAGVSLDNDDFERAR